MINVARPEKELAVMEKRAHESQYALKFVAAAFSHIWNKFSTPRLNLTHIARYSVTRPLQPYRHISLRFLPVAS